MKKTRVTGSMSDQDFRICQRIGNSLAQTFADAMAATDDGTVTTRQMSGKRQRFVGD